MTSLLQAFLLIPHNSNNKEDLTHYPRTLEGDLSMLEKEGCDIAFVPDEKKCIPNLICGFLVLETSTKLWKENTGPDISTVWHRS